MIQHLILKCKYSFMISVICHLEEGDETIQVQRSEGFVDRRSRGLSIQERFVASIFP